MIFREVEGGTLVDKVGDEDGVDVLQCCLFIGPVVGGVGDGPVGWEVEGGVALLGLALVDDLRRQEGPSRGVGQDEGDLSFVIHTGNWYLFCTLRMECPVGCGDDVDTCLV